MLDMRYIFNKERPPFGDVVVPLITKAIIAD